jgi:hypothetical protein
MPKNRKHFCTNVGSTLYKQVRSGEFCSEIEIDFDSFVNVQN